MSTNDPDPLARIGRMPVCASCGSERVLADARAIWNSQTGLWELSAVLDHRHCEICDSAATVRWIEASLPATECIRALNDALRCHGRGNGKILVTQGIHALGEAFAAQAVAAMRTFNDFSQDNDVYHEHDFAAFEVAGERLFFKIDYYNQTLDGGSENPANRETTVRVLTLMLANEY